VELRLSSQAAPYLLDNLPGAVVTSSDTDIQVSTLKELTDETSDEAVTGTICVLDLFRRALDRSETADFATSCRSTDDGLLGTVGDDNIAAGLALSARKLTDFLSDEVEVLGLLPLHLLGDGGGFCLVAEEVIDILNHLAHVVPEEVGEERSRDVEHEVLTFRESALAEIDEGSRADSGEETLAVVHLGAGQCLLNIRVGAQMLDLVELSSGKGRDESTLLVSDECCTATGRPLVSLKEEGLHARVSDGLAEDLAALVLANAANEGDTAGVGLAEHPLKSTSSVHGGATRAVNDVRRGLDARIERHVLFLSEDCSALLQPELLKSVVSSVCRDIQQRIANASVLQHLS